MNLIDNFLNKITMYRLVLYYLILLLAAAVILSFFGVISYNPFSIIISTLILTVVCLFVNKIFAKVLHVSSNVESAYISALILALIISPIKSLQDVPFLLWAGMFAMASKYVLTINKKHIFNPAAIAVVLTAFIFGDSASWWVGTASMLPFVCLGFLIVRKIRRYNLVFYFFLSSLVTVVIFGIIGGNNLSELFKNIIFNSPLIFFAFIMLTEPLTAPPTKTLQSLYAGFVGIMIAPQMHIGTFYTSPEISLSLGNIFSYIVSPKYKLIMALNQKIQSAPDIISFFFVPKNKVVFSPGQYMEWTLFHQHPDARGNRRYFTIASSPTEKTLMLGVKTYSNGSSYKKAMMSLSNNTPIIGSQLAGDFVLPKDPNQKCVFIAGGIGITPFRSMIKYLVDKKEKRPIILFYTNKTIEGIVYSDVFDQAQQELTIKTIYTLTSKDKIPANWKGQKGRIDADLIRKEVPDYSERIFYISGSSLMISGFSQILHNMGILEKRIKKDFFPGFA